MAANEVLVDGALDFLGGQDASKIPDRIAENCYYGGINVSVQKGSLKPRWGFVKQNLNFKDETLTLHSRNKRSYEDIFLSGKFQAIAPYNIGSESYFVIVVSGIIYLVNQETRNVSILNIKDGSKINERASRINWAAAGRFLILFDFPDFPVIIEEMTARRADPALMEIPPSTFGTYNQNRLFIANGGNEFTAGDPWGNVLTPEAPITFTEVELLASPFYGQIFQIPTNYNNDPITCMGFLQMTDTSTGIGPLLVATKRGIYSYNSQQPRTQWEAGQFGTALVFNSGIAGPRAMCNVNSDVFFISPDGQLRTVSMSRDEQRKWTKEPISREVENWLKYYEKPLSQFSVISYFKNKIFVTANPFRSRSRTLERLPIADYAFGGMVVLETDNIATLGSTAPPVWGGLWTGVRPMDMLINDERMFVISKDREYHNNIYEVDPSITYDVDGKKIRFVRSRVYTREFDFKDPFVNKAAHSVQFNFDTLQGDFELEVKYKPSHSPTFSLWKVFKHLFPWRTCKVPKGLELNGFEGEHIRDFNLGTPEEELCSPVNRDYYNVFRKVQLRITITAKYWEIHEIRVMAIEQPLLQNITVCDEYPPVAIPSDCNDDWNVGEFESCQPIQT